MTPNPTPTDYSRQEQSKAQSGLANVFRNLGLRNRSGFSISSTATPSSSSIANRSTSQFEYFPEVPEDGVQDLLERLRKDKALPERVVAAEMLRSTVADFSSQAVTDIWYIAQDLVEDENPAEARQAGFKLLTACLKALTDPSALDRLRYYRTIAQHENIDDFDDQLQAMLVLTTGGRNLSSFEREIGGLLSKWLKILFLEAGRARQLRKREGGSSETVSGAEFCLKELFKFVTDIMKFNFQTFEEREIGQLLSDVLSISRKTTNKRDIECSIVFIETLITYGYIPPDSLRPCIEILCGTYSTIRDLADDTWNAVSNLCKSHMAHKCILTLLEILRKTSKRNSGPNTNTLRGAIWFLEKLLLENGENGLPKFQVSVVMSAFRDAISRDSPRLEMSVCGAICRVLARPDIISQISFDEWAIPLEILVHVSRRTTERADGMSLQRLGVKNVPKARTQDKEVNTAISQSLFQIVNQLEEACRQTDFTQVEGVVEFFLEVYGHIPDSAAEFVLNYYASMHLCYPSCAEWLENSRRLVDVFFRTRKRPSELRVQVLSLIKDVYDTIREVCEESLLHQLVLVAFDDFQTETDSKVLEALVKMIVDVAADSNMDMFYQLIGILIEYMRLEQNVDIPLSGGASENVHLSALRPSHGVYSSHGSLANIVARGLVKMFIRNMNTSAPKAVRVYEELVKIAGSSICEDDARLTAMKLLFRLRADSENYVFLMDSTESDYLARVLNRNGAPSEEKEAASALSNPKEEETPSSSRSNRSNSVSQSMLFRHSSSRGAPERHDKHKKRFPLWSYPDLRPLPEAPPQDASPVLLTFYDPGSEFPAREGPTLDPKGALRVSRWVEQVIPIVQQGCDWEIYSYVLCHLPSQLANKTMFRNCKAHIGYLRSYVCDQLHTNRLPDTDLPSDIKRADIAVSLIHMLTVLISYREHFAKNETEGIVKAFQLGLHSWNRTAKPCIHALSLCCYELPGSTSKFLSGILTKLSQIITSPVVSVHILEFLSALAKLPSLYSNFTEPDFRNIFGIAFRYIQHARETATQRSSFHARASSRETPENSLAEQSDLPQYVLTLAYNVLTTWFLSLRLSERSKYVSWIIRGLVLHDHSNHLDEQSEACIDMLQRYTFSRRDLKPPQKLTSSNIVAKNWVNGMTILSIEMAPDSGMSRITIRRPAGASYYSLKPDYSDLRGVVLQHLDVGSHVESDNDEFDVTKLLPSHLLLQFAGGTALTEQRPILLPEDEKTTRAIDVFDRIPIVDFHKIGVVYVGAGQTEEKEILSNAMGSPDYTDFVDGLGDLVKLQGGDLNTGGLDCVGDFDGEFTYFWRDRTTEIVFHITTMMPTREEDPLCTYKKRHIGNDFVNIIFNNSGLPWRFGTIPSQFNFVSIAISPEARSSFVSSRVRTRGPDDSVFYRVQVCCREGFSDISPAQEPKMVSAKSLPSFVRNLALNASVYSHVFNEGGREYISNPRHRLRSIKQLRERVGASLNTFGSAGGAMSPIRQTNPNRRVSAMSTQTNSTEYSLRSSTIQVNGDAERESETEDLFMSLDFSRYT